MQIMTREKIVRKKNVQIILYVTNKILAILILMLVIEVMELIILFIILVI